MKTFGRTGVVAAIVLALAAYAYFVEYKGAEKEKQKQEETEKLVQIDKDSISKVEIDRAGKKLKLEKAGTQWKVTEPLTDLADSSQVDQLLSSLTNEKSKDTVAEGESVDWKNFGLDNPVGYIKVSAGDKTTTFSVGTVKAYDSSNYLRIDQEKKVRLGSSTWDSFLNKLAQEFRDKRVMRLETTPIYDYIEIVSQNKGKKSRFELKRTDGIWRPKDSKDAFPIAGDKVVLFIDSIKNLRANEFVDKDPVKDAKELGLLDPALVVRLKEGANAPFELKISAPPKNNESKVYAVASGVQAVASFFKTATDPLKKELGDFFDKKLPFQFENNQAQKLTLEMGKAAHEFKFETGKWKLINTTEKDKNFEPDKVSDLVGKLSRLEASEILAAAPKGAQLPFKIAGTVDISNDKGESVLKLRWSDPKDKLVTIATNKTERLVTVAEVTWNGLGFDKLLAAKPAAANPDAPKKEIPKPADPHAGHQH